jgi:hypothetical protein
MNPSTHSGNPQPVPQAFKAICRRSLGHPNRPGGSVAETRYWIKTDKPRQIHFSHSKVRLSDIAWILCRRVTPFKPFSFEITLPMKVRVSRLWIFVTVQQ